MPEDDTVKDHCVHFFFSFGKPGRHTPPHSPAIGPACVTSSGGVLWVAMTVSLSVPTFDIG